MKNTLKDAYGKYFNEMIAISRSPEKIDATNVYQEANLGLRKYMNIMLDENFLEGSGLNNIENFKSFYNAVTKEGKRGLILMEHYTNLDLPAIIYLLDKYGEEWSKDFSKKIVAVAGMKLNEASPMIRVWAEGFTRVVIYPTRSLNCINDNSKVTEEEKIKEEKKARKINLAAMHAMDECKKRGQFILVFPSGTRYRPGNPETKKGLKEIDSYLRLFDIMILVSVNGSCLRFNPDAPENMIEDIVAKDKVILSASPIIECKKFRKEVISSLPPEETDTKQKIVDHVMQILEQMHEYTEKNIRFKN